MNICNEIFTIDLDECIGTSLATINSNYLKLQQQACEDSSELSRLTQDLIALSSSYLELSAKIPSVPKAWIVFNGNSGSNPTVFASYNMSVSSFGTGRYVVTYGTPFPTLSYALIGSSSSTTATSFYTWLQPTTAFSPASATINIHDHIGSFANPEYVSIAIYYK